MVSKLVRAALLAALLLAPAASAAPPTGSAAPPEPLAVSGAPGYLNTKLTPAGAIAPGSSCSWTSNGVQVSTSCSGYVVQSSDAGHTIVLQVTTAGVSVAEPIKAVFNLPANSQYVSLFR